jgi:hypothetical protein
MKEMEADINAQAAVHQEKTNAEMKAGQAEMEAKTEVRLERMEAAMHSIRSDIERTVQQHMEALLEGLRSCGNGTTICKVALEACPDLEVIPEETEAILERWELCKEETNVENIGSLEER